MYIDTKDNDADGRCVLNAEKADRLVTSEVGTIKRPVYFTGGKPTQCVNSFVFHEVIGDVSNIGGEDLYVKRTGDTMTGMLTATGFNGPLYGNALSADKLNTSKGNSTNPVYFNNGVPVACTGTTVPAGGQSGQVLTTNASGSAEWKELVALPKGGTQNQILIKNSSTDGDASWGTNAPTASKLATARTIRTNLASTSTASFDGSGNITPGVTGTLPIANGGTSGTTKNGAYTNLLHQGDLSDATINLKRGMYSYGTSASNTPGSYGCVYNVIANNISEGVAIGGTTSASWVWQVAFDTSQTAPYIRNSVNAAAFNTWRRFWIQGDAVTGAVWNDYAECRESDCEDFGYVLMEVGDDSLTKTTERLSHFAGVSSDTWGFSQGETDKAKTHIAVAGRVLVYTYQNRNNYKPGDCVCAAPGGTVDIMTREEIKEYPDRIVGTVSCVPDYEEWGGGENADRPPVKVNNRIWIKVK